MLGGWKVLIADGDPTARRSLADSLRRTDEFMITEAGTAAEVIAALERRPFDVIILEITLPDMDGRDLCRLIRRRGAGSPVLMLTHHESDADVILALDAGANDCIDKPVHTGVFLARLRAHLRQYTHSDDVGFPIQHYVFRPSAKLLMDAAEGKQIRLTEKETILLKYLHQARNTAVSREELLRVVWGYSPGATTHTIETHVWRLRQKIERDPTNAEIVKTEAGGYRLYTDARPGSQPQKPEQHADLESRQWNANGSSLAPSPLLGN